MTEHNREYLFEAVPNLDQLKTNIRMTSDDLDDQLNAYLQAAIDNAEMYIGRRIALSRFTYDGPFVSDLTLEAPFQSVESVEVDGQAVTNYEVKDGVLSVPGEGTALTVVYFAGMRNVPAAVRHAVIMDATALFNNPSDSVASLPTRSSKMLMPYRNWNGK